MTKGWESSWARWAAFGKAGISAFFFFLIGSHSKSKSSWDFGQDYSSTVLRHIGLRVPWGRGRCLQAQGRLNGSFLVLPASGTLADSLEASSTWRKNNESKSGNPRGHCREPEWGPRHRPAIVLPITVATETVSPQEAERCVTPTLPGALLHPTASDRDTSTPLPRPPRSPACPAPAPTPDPGPRQATTWCSRGAGAPAPSPKQHSLLRVGPSCCRSAFFMPLDWFRLFLFCFSALTYYVIYLFMNK